jgi:NAD(P)-dependent dehydrogenase (short-subunit alcohol dehydrogenase family)
MKAKRFEGKVAIVTGGSLGIGRSTAIQLADEGAHVVACARRKPKLDELEAAIRERGGSFTGVGLDVADIDGFFGVSVESVFIGVQAAMKVMQPQGFGSIINISSVSSLRAGIAAGAYSAAKAAVNQFTMCAAMEAAPYNVRINVVAPGAVMTPGLDASTMKNKAMQDAIAGSIPLQRIGTPEEMAEAICFLASDDASFITGVVLPVDGGKTPQMHIPDFDLTALDNRDID